jgi:hypothetical protein
MKKPRNGRIDTATGQDKRVKVTINPVRGPRPERSGGHIVPKGRLAHQRARKGL